MKYPKPEIRKVLVTGCSSGIGAATARLLRDHDWEVIPTARKPDDLEHLRSQGFTPVRLDVSNSDSVNKAAEEVLGHFGGEIGALVNNAGFGQPGALEDLSRNAMVYQFEVNLFGLQELTNIFIPVFRQQGYGRIVNVSSMLGRISLPFMGIYSASKFALEATSDAQRVELKEAGIAVSIVEPGPIKTKFRDSAIEHGRTHLDVEGSTFSAGYKRRFAHTKEEHEPLRAPFTKPPEAVASKVLHAVESARPRIRYPVTFPAYAGEWMRRFAPYGLIDHLMIARAAKKHASKE